MHQAFREMFTGHFNRGFDDEMYEDEEDFYYDAEYRYDEDEDYDDDDDDDDDEDENKDGKVGCFCDFAHTN